MFKTLIVEDSITFRMLLKDMLTVRFPSMAIEEAGDGKQAMEKVDMYTPDLIFMDIKLPEESGLEITKKIKEKYPGTKVIVLTNYDIPEYREAAHRNGADYFFTKSSTFEEIEKLVESIMNSGHKTRTSH